MGTAPGLLARMFFHHPVRSLLSRCCEYGKTPYRVVFRGSEIRPNRACPFRLHQLRSANG